MQKIGMILDEEYPPDPRVENEALTLIEHGHEVYLFCLDYTGNATFRDEYKGIHIRRKKIPTLVYKLSALAYTLPFYHLYLKKSVKSFIIETGVDTIHVHDIRVARTVFMVNKALKKRIIIDLHENRPEIMKFYGYVDSLLGKLLIYPKRWKKMEYKYLRKADHVIVVTEKAKEYYLKELKDQPEDKFIALPNAVRKGFYSDFKLNKDIQANYKDKFSIIYVGDTGLRRGLETAIKAVALLKSQIPEIKLVLVGKSKADQILLDLCIELGVENEVDMVGWKDASLFPSYISSSDLGISPIHKNIHHDTTYANKIFQYMAFGVPIIVSNCDAQEAVVNKYNVGKVFEDRNEEDLANKIIKLYKDRSLLKSYQENAKKVIEDFLRWEKVSKNFTELYKSFDRS